MFDVKEFYYAENSKVLDSYEASINEIKGIREKTEGCDVCSEKAEYYKFFNHTSKLLIKLMDFEKKLSEEYFNNNTIEELMKENNQFFHELLPQNYETSYGNPSFAVKAMGEGFGQLFSNLYVDFQKYIGYAFKHKIFEMEKYNNLFTDLFFYVFTKTLDYDAMLNLLRDYKLKDLTKYMKVGLNENMNKEFRFYTDIYEEDLTDLRYLFRFGEYVTENEIQTAKLLLKYSDDKLTSLADTIVDAYVRGFKVDNKDITKRSVVKIICSLGQERIIKHMIESFKSRNLDTLVAEIETTSVNKQYEYDHKFDKALLLNEEYIKLGEIAYMAAVEECKHFLKDFSGDMVVEKFGENPFSPEKKSEPLKFSEVQMSLEGVYKTKRLEIIEKYAPRVETSFCIVAFPTPEIGDNYEEIFEDILKINMLDNGKNEIIQQNIIDVLDKGEYVYIKGKGKNLTDIKVNLQELKCPGKETNFLNCGADVNIPLGEVFTTPLLKGTNGLIHVEETYLDGFNYIDLKLEFKDGIITDYICSNFEKEDDNRSYIKENLLFPHNTLPLSEFAIGTNTLAYVISEKYKIIDKLPILIIEKMGPHFAIGDTCFSWVEDNRIYNLIDNKEVVAKDNEKSITRKEDKYGAYTNCHTDITLPYDSIGVISSITKEGEEIDIIRDGRFVLNGTEELNEPFVK